VRLGRGKNPDRSRSAARRERGDRDPAGIVGQIRGGQGIGRAGRRSVSVHATAYPAAYGFIPGTLAEDGDPADALVLVPAAVVPGAVVHARPIGLLRMRDEKGNDEKIVCVPLDRIHPQYSNIETIDDLPPITRKAIEHFFSRYKDLEEGKWADVTGWGSRDEAEEAIRKAIAAAKR
jgi:inorganic pyrophosphatase